MYVGFAPISHVYHNILAPCMPVCRAVLDLLATVETQDRQEPMDHQDPLVFPVTTDETERRDIQDLGDHPETL